MNLYLMQHGEARSREDDPEQGLTQKGITDIEKTAETAGSLGIRPTTIYHSGKKRTIETAELLSQYLNPFNGVRVTDFLGPNDDVLEWARRIVKLHDEIILVGHLPHLQRLSSLLLCGDPENEIIRFTNSALICLELTRGVGWSIRWITP